MGVKITNLPPASAVQHPPPSQLLNLCGEQPLFQNQLEMPHFRASLLQGSPLLAVAAFSLLAHRVTGRTFPTSHKDSCALCPPDTDKAPQAVATPEEGAAKHNSDGGLPVSPGDPSLLLEEQRANSLTQHAKPRNLTGATQREGSQIQQQIKGEKKTKDDYYYLTALRLCLY